jgi:hypothetical protein
VEPRNFLRVTSTFGSLSILPGVKGSFHKHKYTRPELFRSQQDRPWTPSTPPRLTSSWCHKVRLYEECLANISPSMSCYELLYTSPGDIHGLC